MHHQTGAEAAIIIVIGESVSLAGGFKRGSNACCQDEYRLTEE